MTIGLAVHCSPNQHSSGACYKPHLRPLRGDLLGDSSVTSLPHGKHLRWLATSASALPDEEPYASQTASLSRTMLDKELVLPAASVTFSASESAMDEGIPPPSSSATHSAQLEKGEEDPSMSWSSSPSASHGMPEHPDGPPSHSVSPTTPGQAVSCGCCTIPGSVECV